MDQSQATVENTVLSTTLLAPLFSQITDNQRLKILDMGMASSATVNFFRVKRKVDYNFAV